jgi:hypothetical protein
MTAERCERCDRLVATAEDWDAEDCPTCGGDLSDDGCKCGWSAARCWTGATTCVEIDWRTRALQLADYLASDSGTVRYWMELADLDIRARDGKPPVQP